MMRSFTLFLVACAPVALWAQEQVPTEDQERGAAVRFMAVNVWIDTQGTPLAAWQVELAGERPEVQIVGVEGGDHAAFSSPPYYDPKALSDRRIIIAAFNTGEDLPTGRTRVARIHLRIEGAGEPGFTAKECVAVSPDGNEIHPTVSVEEEKAR